MAHRLERRAVRGAGHAAGARVRALSVAALVLIAAIAPPGGARAADLDATALRSLVLPDVSAWWSEPGRAGFVPEAWLGTGFAPSFAGLAVGGTAIEDHGDGAPRDAWPGMPTLARPATALDSVVVEPLPMRAGFDAPLARVIGGRARAGDRRARAAFGYDNGDYGVEGSSLLAERGDGDRLIRVESIESTRLGAGSLGLAGRHAWGLFARTARGAHRFEGSYAQRAVAGELAEREWGEAANGEAGHLGWSWRDATRRAALVLERAHDAHESFGSVLAWSRREAEENRATLAAGITRGTDALEAEAGWSRTRVRRVYEGFPEAGFDLRADAWRAALRASRGREDGRLEGELEVAGHDAFSGARLAPALAYRFEGRGVRGAVSAARLLAPVWTDLAPGERPFLQGTWAGGLDVSAHGAAARARVTLLGGVTHDRALVTPEPFVDWWLRDGLARESGRATFALARLEAGWQGRRLEAGAEGFALGREDLEFDPARGFRAYLGTRFALFTGDLGVSVRIEAEGMGARIGAAPVSERIPAYASAGARLALRLSDAMFTIRARNLEDVRRPEPWVDRATGLPAIGTGREIRYALSWLLFD